MRHLLLCECNTLTRRHLLVFSQCEMSRHENNTSLHEVITAADAEDNCYDNEAFTDEPVSHSNNDSSVAPAKSPIDTTFVMVHRNVLPKSDFAAEVRGKLDAKHYFKEMSVLLDAPGVTLDAVVNDLLSEVSTVALVIGDRVTDQLTVSCRCCHLKRKSVKRCLCSSSTKRGERSVVHYKEHSRRMMRRLIQRGSSGWHLCHTCRARK